MQYNIIKSHKNKKHIDERQYVWALGAMSVFSLKRDLPGTPMSIIPFRFLNKIVVPGVFTIADNGWDSTNGVCKTASILSKKVMNRPRSA